MEPLCKWAVFAKILDNVLKSLFIIQNYIHGLTKLYYILQNELFNTIYG